MLKQALNRLEWRWRRIKDAIPRKVASVLPRKVAYWCAVRVWAHGTMGRWGNEHPTDLTVHTALNRWKIDNRKHGPI